MGVVQNNKGRFRMSDRLIMAYEHKHAKEIAKRVAEKNKAHLERLRRAGELYKARHHMEDDVCPKCGRADTIGFVETPEFIHYGKMVCLRCKKYLRWVAYPMGIGRAWTEELFQRRGLKS